MSISRRSFLGGALALSAATSMPLKAFAHAPVIYGDGVHDDTAGLQAALDGKPFRVFGHGAYVVRGDGHIFIGNGSFRLSDTLHFRGNVAATVSGFHMEWTELPPGAACMMMSENSRTVLMDGTIERPVGGWLVVDDRFLAHEHLNTCNVA